MNIHRLKSYIDTFKKKENMGLILGPLLFVVIGKEILEIDVNEVIQDLNSAYADEWLSHYQYFLYAQVIEDIDVETLKEKLEEQSNGEMNHAKE